MDENGNDDGVADAVEKQHRIQEQVDSADRARTEKPKASVNQAIMAGASR